jgi:hypothetical protein
MMLARTQCENDNAQVEDWEKTALALRDELAKVTESKNSAYSERNALVAILARMYPSELQTTDIPGWHPDWHNCVYIDTPQGQMSWHYLLRDAPLFAGLPRYEKEWEGHTTEEKYERLAKLGGRLAEWEKIRKGREKKQIQVTRELCDALEGCLTHMRIWASRKGDMSGFIAERVEKCEALLARVRGKPRP